jgi:hypothetical protein
LMTAKTGAALVRSANRQIRKRDESMGDGVRDLRREAMPGVPKCRCLGCLQGEET